MPDKTLHSSPLPTPRFRSPPSFHYSSVPALLASHLALHEALFSTQEPERLLKQSSAHVSPCSLSDTVSPFTGHEPLCNLILVSSDPFLFLSPGPSSSACLSGHSAKSGPWCHVPESPGQGKLGPGGTFHPSLTSSPCPHKLGCLAWWCHWPGCRCHSSCRSLRRLGVGG